MKRVQKITKEIIVLVLCFTMLLTASLTYATTNDATNGQDDIVTVDETLSNPEDWSQNKAVQYQFVDLTDEKFIFDVYFKDLKDDEIPHGGDKISLSLPSEYMSIENTQEKVNVYAGKQENLGQKDVTLESQLFATYEIVDNQLTLTLDENFETLNNQYFGRIEIPMQWIRQKLTLENQNISWDVVTYDDQTTQSMLLTLPARTMIDWSQEQDYLSFKVIEDENQNYQLQFQFLKTDEKRPVMAGDKAYYSLKDSEYIIDPVSEATDIKVQDQVIATYTTDGETIDITFTEGIENQENLTELIGMIPVKLKVEPAVPITEVKPQVPATDNLQQNQNEDEEDKEKYIKLGDGIIFTYNDQSQKNEQISQQIYWVDNNNTTKRPDNTVLINQYEDIQVSYTLDGQTFNHTLSFDDLEKQLGIQGNLLNVRNPGNGQLLYIPEDTLPVTGQINDQEVTLNWSFSSKEVINGSSPYQYYFVDNSNNQYEDMAKGWYYIETFDYTITVEQRSGNTNISGFRDAFLKSFSFFYKANYTDNKFNSSLLKTLDEEGHIKIVNDESSHQYHITIQNVPRYFIDEYQRLFHIKATDELSSGITFPNEKDYFKISYENDPNSNYYGRTDGAYSGGKIILTLTGETKYNAYKIWGDKAKEDKNRPDISFELWRYTNKDGQSFRDASPVKNANGELLKVYIKGNSSKDNFSISFYESAYSEGEIDEAQSAFLAEESENIETLPRYDSEGNEYIYFTRETIINQSGSDQYVKVYGKVGENGQLEDTLPYEGNRDSVDASIYNGGTIINQLSGQVTTQVTKKWNASTFQTAFEDIKVEVKLQSRIKGDDNAEWKDVQTYTFVDFDAEFLSKTTSSTAPKYDYYGNELEYRWIETGVYDATTSEDNPIVPDKDGYFTIHQNGQEVRYQSVSETKVDNNQYETMIENNLDDVYEYNIDKKWYEDGKEVKAPENAKVYLQLLYLQNGEYTPIYIGENDIILDGIVDEKETEVDVTIAGENHKITYIEDKKWHLHVELPKYNKVGELFTYFVLENRAENADGFSPQYESRFDEDGNYYTEIQNVKGPGQSIYIYKDWIDGSDTEHRGAVTFSAYLRIAENNFILIPTDPNKMTLTAEDVWWKQVGIPLTVKDDKGNEYDVVKEKVVVVETEVRSTPDENEGTEITFKDDELENIYQDYHKQNGENNDNQSHKHKEFTTAEHKYRQLYSMFTVKNDTSGIEFYKVTNQRLGNINIDVTKSWKDAGVNSQERQALQKELHDNNAKLYLQLSCIDYPDAINKENGTVNLGVEDVPIYNNQKLEGKGSYRVTIDLEENTKTYYFYNLPKYDTTSQVAHYEVNEVVVMGEREMTLSQFVNSISGLRDQAPYSSTVTLNDYEANHTGTDQQIIKIENRLSDTKDVVFYKEWRDEYRNENGERPDISLDIYQLLTDENGKKKLSLYYKDYSWSKLDSNTEVQSQDDMWSITFKELPKYDDYGKEIIYYAKENVIINRDTFDYLDAQYYYKIDDKTVKVGDEVDGPLSGYENAGYLYPLTENDQQTFLLKENGMFVNQIEKNIEINGKKIWRDLPSGYSEDNLPKVVLQLYQCDSNDNELNDGNPYATIMIDNWKKLKNSEGNYVFAFKYKGTNTNYIDKNGDLIVKGETDAQEIPQYDENGNRYTYQIEEDIQFFEENNTQPNDNQVYGKDYDNNAYMITNNYQSVKGDLAVKKIIANADLKEGEQYPNVTFTLERSYTANDDSQITDNNFKRIGTIKYNEFDNGIAYYTFSDLDVYAPNGSLYQYKVTETKINSYKTEVGSGDLNSDYDKWKVTNEISGITLTPKSSIGVINAIKAALNQDQTKTVTFKNTYTPEIIKIQGQKIWNDDGNSARLRPQSNEMTLTLTRYANAQEGSKNNITVQNLKENEDYTLAWSNTDSNTWTYTITGIDAKFELEKYAPNGMPWIYRVKEEMTSPANDIYVKAPSIDDIDGIVENNADNANNNGIVNMPDLTNTLLTSASGTKNWDITADNPNDILNDYLGYQMVVEFELQARIKGYIRNKSATGFSGNWENAYELINNHVENNDVLNKYTNSTQKVNSLYFGKNASVKFESLYNAVKVDKQRPVGSVIVENDIILLEYRVVEKSLTVHKDNQSVTINFIIGNDGIYSSVEINNSIFELPTGINGNIINKLPTTSLKITKNWVNDNDNIYGTRPKNPDNGNEWITRFVVQRSTGNSQWENVKKYTNGVNPIDYVVSITGNDNDDSKSITINDLPQYGYIVDENTNSLKRVEYQYRVRELMDGMTEPGDNNKNVIMDPNVPFYDTYTVEYDDTLNQPGQECIVTNTLQTIPEVAATKNWKNKDEFTKNVIFEIKYLKENGDQDNIDDWNSFNPKAEVILNGEIDGMTDKAYGEHDAWKAIWNDLPKHMPGSKVYSGQTIYKVFEIADNGLYVEESRDSNQSQVFTNTPTKLQVQKIVDMGAYNGTLNTEYQFTITKLLKDNEYVDTSFNGSYQYRIIQDGQLVEESTLDFTNGNATFNLKHNQTITIYGLPKGFSYSVVENGVSVDLSNQFIPSVSLNEKDYINGNSCLLTIDSTKQTLIPKATFKNLYEGQIHIQKNDEFGKALEGVKFKIEYAEDQTYKTINDTVCSNTDLLEVMGKLATNDSGEVIFTGLKLGYSYRITEVSSISNHNKLIEPIIIELPVLTDSQSSDTINPIGKVDDKFVYTQVTYTITNNAALTMPTTGRQHLYYFGVAGFTIIALACGYWIMSDKKKKKVRK